MTLHQGDRAHILVYGVALIILLPFIWVLLSAFKSESELLRYPPTLLPREWTFAELHPVLQGDVVPHRHVQFRHDRRRDDGVRHGVAAPAAYALARFHHPLFENIARLFIYTYMIPSILLVLPVYKIFFNLGLANNLWGLGADLHGAGAAADAVDAPFLLRRHPGGAGGGGDDRRRDAVPGVLEGGAAAGHTGHDRHRASSPSTSGGASTCSPPRC